VLDISTVQDTEQKLTFKGPRTSNSSDKEWREFAEIDSLKQDATNNNPEETKNKFSDCNSTTEMPGSLTVRDSEQKPTSKGLRTSIRQKNLQQ